MPRSSRSARAAIGVADHCGWAVLMTATGDGAVLDRRRLELLADGLPRLPHHHECQGLPLDQARDLIARVQTSAEQHARTGLDALARTVGAEIAAIALRACPPLPSTLAERLGNYRAQNVADTVTYRHVLADAATTRGWRVVWYESTSVRAAAERTLKGQPIADLFAQVKARLGSPWTEDHRVALAAAIVATGT